MHWLLIFLYARPPAALFFVTTASSSLPLKGFTLQWYAQMAENARSRRRW